MNWRSLENFYIEIGWLQTTVTRYLQQHSPFQSRKRMLKSGFGSPESMNSVKGVHCFSWRIAVWWASTASSKLHLRVTNLLQVLMRVEHWKLRKHSNGIRMAGCYLCSLGISQASRNPIPDRPYEFILDYSVCWVHKGTPTIIADRMPCTRRLLLNLSRTLNQCTMYASRAVRSSNGETQEGKRKVWRNTDNNWTYDWIFSKNARRSRWIVLRYNSFILCTLLTFCQYASHSIRLTLSK